MYLLLQGNFVGNCELGAVFMAASPLDILDLVGGLLCMHLRQCSQQLRWCWHLRRSLLICLPWRRGKQVLRAAQAAEGDSTGLSRGGGRGGTQRHYRHGPASRVRVQDAGQAAPPARSARQRGCIRGRPARQAAPGRQRGRLCAPPRCDAVARALAIARGRRQPPAHAAPAAEGGVPSLPGSLLFRTATDNVTPHHYGCQQQQDIQLVSV